MEDKFKIYQATDKEEDKSGKLHNALLDYCNNKRLYEVEKDIEIKLLRQERKAAIVIEKMKKAFQE